MTQQGNLETRITLTADPREMLAGLESARQGSLKAFGEMRAAAAGLAETEKAAALERARNALGVRPHADLLKGIEAARAAYDTLRHSGKVSLAEIAQAKLKLLERTRELQQQANGWGDALTKVKLSAMSAAASAAGIAAAVTQAASFEAAMVRAQKYIDFPEKNGFERLRGSLLAMTRELPLTAAELSKIAAAGGQAGVAADELEKFVPAVAKIAIAFDMLPEDGAAAFGKLRSLFGLSVDAAIDLGDVVNQLGDKMANVAEKDIVNVMTRTGGVAKMMGVTAQETAALATAMLTLGAPAEVAANALNALIAKLSTLESADPAIKKAFRDNIGSISEFSAALRRDPVAAIDFFLEKINGLSAQAKPIALKEIMGLEYYDDIAKLAGGIDGFRQALALARDETARGGVDRQFQEEMKTTEQQFALLKNAVAETAINLGSSLLPAVAKTTTAIAHLTRGLADMAREFPQITSAVSLMVTGMLGIGAARVGVAALGGLVARLGGAAAAASAMSTSRCSACGRQRPQLDQPRRRQDARRTVCRRRARIPPNLG